MQLLTESAVVCRVRQGLGAGLTNGSAACEAAKFFLPSLLPGAGQHFWSTQFASVLVQVQGWSRFLYQQFYKLFAFSAAAWRDDIQYELCITLFKNIPKKKHNLQSISWFHNFRLNHHLPWQPLVHGLKPNLFWWLRCTCLCWSWLLNR